jgi:hypothetical protein
MPRKHQRNVTSKKLQETLNKARKTLKDVGKTHIDDGDEKKKTLGKC